MRNSKKYTSLQFLEGELGAALNRCKQALLWLAVASGLVNVLSLTGSFFMLQVYDRVIPSRSVPTLIGLSLLALLLFAFQGVLETLRGRVLARIGTALHEALAPRVFDLTVRAPLRGEARDAGQPLRDLDQIRAFLAGAGPGAILDLPWMPFYLLICFLFHPAIGLAALCGAGLLTVLALVTDRLARAPSGDTTERLQARNRLAESGRRNAEVLGAMGMRRSFGALWREENDAYLAAQKRVSDVATGLGTASRVARTALQSGVLALGAYLVINGQATPGVIIASSILVSRALAPAELAIANWKGFVSMTQSWRRLEESFERIPAEPAALPLPAPVASLSVEGVSVAPPGVPRLVVQDLGFTLKAGQGLGVIGPSASGKSSLVRALVGIWPALRGTVRLDAAALDQWDPVARGRHVGYLPQEVELFPGNLAQNIARFDPDATPEKVLDAARAAGVHEMILRLPDGYRTEIGEGGAGLSAGQRQRVGLARALYGDPFLVVLDEPNANLDAEGEGALTQAMLGVRARGGIVVVVAHRPSALAGVDLVMLMAEGRIQSIGAKDDVLRKILRPTAVAGGRAA